MSELTRRLPQIPFLAMSRFTLGLVFLYASFGKILDPKEFAENLLDYHIFDSPYLIKYLAVTLPWIEWFCGIFLILGIFVRSISILSTGLLMIFIAAMASAKIRGLEIHCGCFGPTHEVISPFTLLRDILFLLMSLAVMASKVDPLALQSFIAKRKHHKQ
jgi:uncharacterized membrane protein YphA (DoxX/SURF4 family)